jgi:hypothetical protein
MNLATPLKEILHVLVWIYTKKKRNIHGNLVTLHGCGQIENFNLNIENIANFRKIWIIAPVLDSIIIILACIFENKCDFYTLGVLNNSDKRKKLNIATSVFASGQGLPYPALCLGFEVKIECHSFWRICILCVFRVFKF